MRPITCRAFIRERKARRWPWLVVLALVVPLWACSTECERAAEKACRATQAANFDICIKRATAKVCKANFDSCVRHEVIRCRGGR